MSGPKLSQAELERRRREQLAGQRRSYVDAAARLRRKKGGDQSLDEFGGVPEAEQ